MPRRDTRDLLYDREPMGRLRLTPQKREFFDLYSRASANTVEISRLLVELLERFPAEDGGLIAQIAWLLTIPAAGPRRRGALLAGAERLLDPL
jgi:hypothetical protein